MAKRQRTLVKLPPEQPDRCRDCPLLGLVPISKRKKGSHKTYVCIATMKALSSRGIDISASARDDHHPLKRPCDDRWASFMLAPNMKLQVNSQAYLDCRIPYEQKQQYKIDFEE